MSPPTYRELERRLTRLEAARAPALRSLPPVLTVGIGQTIADFADRFAGRSRKKKQTVLVVPAKVRTAAEEADFLTRFKAQQQRLVADAKASRPAPPPESPPKFEQSAPDRRLVRGRIRIGEPFRAPKPEHKD